MSDEEAELANDEYCDGCVAGEKWAATQPVEFCQFVSEFRNAEKVQPAEFIERWRMHVTAWGSLAGQETRTSLDDSPAFHSTCAKIGRLPAELTLPFDGSDVSDDYQEGFIIGICQRWYDSQVE